jgi:hypothetical protein
MVLLRVPIRIETATGDSIRFPRAITADAVTPTPRVCFAAETAIALETARKTRQQIQRLLWPEWQDLNLQVKEFSSCFNRDHLP